MSAHAGDRFEQDDARELLRLLADFRRRLGREQAWQLLLRGLAAGLALVALAHLGAWLLRGSIPSSTIVAALALPLLLALLLAAACWPSPARAARVADRRLRLEERLGTALELVQGGPRPSPLRDHGPAGLLRWLWRLAAARRQRQLIPTAPAAPSAYQALSGRLARPQLHEAVYKARSRRHDWPLLGDELHADYALLRKSAAVAAVAVFMALTGLRLPLLSPALDALYDAVSAAQATADAAPPALAALEAAPPATDPADPRAGAYSAAERPSAGGAAASADDQDALSLRAQRARALRDPLDHLSRALGQVSAAGPAAESLDRGDYRRAAERLARLGNDAGRLSPQARDDLARALREAADQSAANPALAERARQAADALVGGDAQRQRDALQALGEQVARDGSAVESQRDLAAQQSQLEQQRGDQAGADAGPQGRPSAPAPGQSADGQGPTGEPVDGGGQPSGGPPRGSAAGTGHAPGQGDQPPDGSNPDQTASTDQAGRSSRPAPGATVEPFQPGSSAPRLDAAGRVVGVPIQVSGSDPSLHQVAEPGDTSELGPSTAGSASDALHQQAPAGLAAEQNQVPTDQRQVVRDYFNGEGAGGD